MIKSGYRQGRALQSSLFNMPLSTGRCWLVVLCRAPSHQRRKSLFQRSTAHPTHYRTTKQRMSIIIVTCEQRKRRTILPISRTNTDNTRDFCPNTTSVIAHTIKEQSKCVCSKFGNCDPIVAPSPLDVEDHRRQ